MLKSVKPAGLATLVLAVFLFQCSPARKAADGKREEILFFDDFSGRVLDTSKWSVRITGNTVNNEQQAYVDSSSTLYIAHGQEAAGAANGALVIRPLFRKEFMTPEGKRFDFISGRIDTRKKFAFTHGKAAARIKMTEGAGLWPAWWLLGDGPWPQTGEIDIMEYIGERDWVSAAMHGPGYSGNTPLVKKDTFPGRKSVEQWHIYSVDWSADSLVFKIDGRSFYTVTRPTVERYGNWAFDNDKYLILNFALGGGYPAGVNKVKAPYFGIPESTVEMIRQRKCRFLVDWVKISR